MKPEHLQDLIARHFAEFAPENPAPPARTEKALAAERLRNGTPPLGPPGSPENAANWQAWYDLPYIENARQKARERLTAYAEYLLDEEERW